MSSYLYALAILIVVLVGNIIGPDAAHISIRFYDSILHLLAGAGLGFFLSGLAGSFNMPRFSRSFWVMVGVFVLGFVWEIFEIMYSLSGYPVWTALYYADTIKDLILDVVGAYLAKKIL